MIQKALMAIVIFGIFPELLGMMITKWTKNGHRIFLNYIYGIMIELAITEVLAVPLIILKKPFSVLAGYWLYSCIILCLVSILLNACKFNIKDFLERFKTSIKETHWTIILVFILVFTQTYMLTKYTHYDNDDSRFVVYSTIAVQDDVMYTTDYNAGRNNNVVLSSRDILSPFPMFTAIIAKHLDIHPAIVAHTIFPAILIPVAYMVFWQLGYRLLEENREKANIFCIILSIIYMFGDFSDRYNLVSLLYRIWQGKSILANIVLPMSWLVYYECVTDNKIVNWIALYIMFIAGCLTSEMGIMLMPLSIGAMTVVHMIKYKKISYGIKSLCAVVPCLIYGFMYLVIKT